MRDKVTIDLTSKMLTSSDSSFENDFKKILQGKDKGNNSTSSPQKIDFTFVFDRMITDEDLENFLTVLKSCDLSNHTIGVNFSQSYYLNDDWLNQLSFLSNVTSLRFARNANITDSSLMYLSPSLTVLDLSQCISITDEGMKELNKLSQLNYLLLARNVAITDSSLAYLPPSLAVLDLSHCTTITDEGLKELNKLSRLTSLTLTKCPISGTYFKELPDTLRELDLTECPLTNDSLSTLPNFLKKLILKNCSSLSVEGFKHLKNVSLTTLDMTGINITLDLLDSLPKTLTHLIISNEAKNDLTEILIPFIEKRGNSLRITGIDKDVRAAKESIENHRKTEALATSSNGKEELIPSFSKKVGESSILNHSKEVDSLTPSKEVDSLTPSKEVIRFETFKGDSFYKPKADYTNPFKYYTPTYNDKNCRNISVHAKIAYALADRYPDLLRKSVSVKIELNSLIVHLPNEEVALALGKSLYKERCWNVTYVRKENQSLLLIPSVDIHQFLAEILLFKNPEKSDPEINKCDLNLAGLIAVVRDIFHLQHLIVHDRSAYENTRSEPLLGIFKTKSIFPIKQSFEKQQYDLFSSPLLTKKQLIDELFPTEKEKDSPSFTLCNHYIDRRFSTHLTESDKATIAPNDMLFTDNIVTCIKDYLGMPLTSQKQSSPVKAAERPVFPTSPRLPRTENHHLPTGSSSKRSFRGSVDNTQKESIIIC